MDKEYSLERVPLSGRSNLVTVALIRIGANTSLSQFMLGATLGHAMTFWQAMLATLLGSFILEFIGLGLGFMGCREGLPTCVLSRWCGFGRLGSAIIGLTIAISSLGWFGVQNGIFAKGLEHALHGRLDFTWCAAIAGTVITLLVAFGFKGLGLTAKIAVPLFFFVIAWISFDVLAGLDFRRVFGAAPTGHDTMTLSAAATMVAGGCMVGAISTPDLTRYCRSSKHVFWMMTASIIIGEFVVNGVAILIAHALGTDDVVDILTQSAGFIGLVCGILAIVKINDINLYSVSLGTSNFLQCVTGKKLGFATLTCIAGALGTLFTIAGILDNFVQFLIFTGVIFPPVAGIMLTDYYVVRTHRELLNLTRQAQKIPDLHTAEFINYPAIIAWIIGSFSGFWITIGIPSLNSIFISGVTYFCLSFAKNHFK